MILSSGRGASTSVTLGYTSKNSIVHTLCKKKCTSFVFFFNPKYFFNPYFYLKAARHPNNFFHKHCPEWYSKVDGGGASTSVTYGYTFEKTKISASAALAIHVYSITIKNQICFHNSLCQKKKMYFFFLIFFFFIIKYFQPIFCICTNSSSVFYKLFCLKSVAL